MVIIMIDLNDLNMSIDVKMYEKNVVKLLEMDKNHLFNLLKLLMYKCPDTMEVIDEY